MLRDICRSLLAALLLLGSGHAAAQTSFVEFESGHVRPIALSPDGSQLFAVNTPDNTLEIFDVGVGGLTFAAAVPVGLEPVAVAARTNDEVWVVNHLSDSISIVDLSGAVPIVERTLLVGDEPRDIVFAGAGGNRAFITTAHRGQHRTQSSISGVFGGVLGGLVVGLGASTFEISTMILILGMLNLLCAIGATRIGGAMMTFSLTGAADDARPSV